MTNSHKDYANKTYLGLFTRILVWNAVYQDGLNSGLRLGIREKTFFVILPFSTKQGLNIVRSFGVIHLVLFNNSNFKKSP